MSTLSCRVQSGEGFSVRFKKKVVIKHNNDINCRDGTFSLVRGYTRLHMRQHHDVCPVSIRITGQIVSVPQTIYSLNEKENLNYFIHIAHFKAEPLYVSQTDNVMTAI